MRTYYYACDVCPATKQIRDPYEQTPAPLTLVCGWRGCMGTCRKVGRDIHDERQHDPRFPR